MQEMQVQCLGPWDSLESLQYSCLENSMDRGAWRATVHGVAKELDTDWASTKHKGKESENKKLYVCVCVCVQLNHFTVHLKFTQPCKYYTLILLLMILKVHVSFHSYRSQGKFLSEFHKSKGVCMCVWNSKRRREGEECKFFATGLLHGVRCWDYRNEDNKILILKIKKLSLSLFSSNVNVQLRGQNSDFSLTPALLAFAEDLANFSQLCFSVCCA